MLKTYLVIALGGSIGAVARFYLTTTVSVFYTYLPAGTFLVNCLGCFLLGLLLGIFTLGSELPETLRHFAIVGVLSSFTTFSTLSFELVTMLQKHQWVAFALYLAASVSLGILALVSGHALSKLIVGTL